MVRYASFLLRLLACVDAAVPALGRFHGGAATRPFDDGDLPPGLEIDRRPLPTALEYKAMAEANVVLDPANLAPVAALEETFMLHSLPGATQILFIDFDGRRGGYKAWSLDGDRETFNDEERVVIQQTWRSVAEDFLPFNIDVTTQDPGDGGWIGQVAVIDGMKRHGYSWAYMNSWGVQPTDVAHCDPGDDTWLWIADTIVHEVGHTLGLGHDGPGYYRGHGAGETQWCPSMGWGSFSLNVWSDGAYCGADNGQDDLAIITSRAGIDYRPDDHGDTRSAATLLPTLTATLVLLADGIIERNDRTHHDVDFFEFQLAARSAVQLSINEDVVIGASNLDVFLKLYDGNLAELFTSHDDDPDNTTISASFDGILDAGTYYLSIEGKGWGDPNDCSPPVEGYTDYGLMGHYSIHGAAVTASSCSIDADCDDGTHCNGEETCDAGGNCVDGVDPCPGQDCTEGSGTYICSTSAPTGTPTAASPTLPPTKAPTASPSPEPTEAPSSPQVACTGGGNNYPCPGYAGQSVAPEVCCSGTCKRNERCSSPA